MLLVSATEQREAEKALADATALLHKAVHRLGAPTHPLEAARIQSEFLTLLADEAGTVREMRRDAVLTVYARGRAEYGRFGFGSIATALGTSKARVQQIVGAFKDGHKGDDVGDRVRADADKARAAAKTNQTQQ
ncbi:MAG: hypothetical protein ACOH1Y_11510 [Propionicimonas sp.]